jgi:hypothetical protein
VAKNNPGCITVQHYDPIHDEWVVRYANHLRMKLTSLPQEYAEFLRQNLVPGGSIIFLDSQARWLRYRLGERSYIQVGGWGDISPQEFLDGSERISRFCREVGYQFDRWRLDGYQLEEGPESEWGCEPGLALALEEFCNREGYRLVRISLPDPFDYSKLAFRVIEYQLSQADREPAGVLIECFGQFDATAVLRAGLLPVWLVFNTLDNLGYLESVRPQFPKGKPVFFSPLMTFSFAPDRVPWEEWERALAGLEWINIGPRASHYPADPWVILSWAEPLRRWVKENRIPALPLVIAEKLLEISKGL